jgi:large subunit ribosomal protein L6
MKKDIYQNIRIPKEVELLVEKNAVIVKGKEGENKRSFKFNGLEVKKEEDLLRIGKKKASKNEKREINTITSHIKNMILGAQEKFQYKLKICFSHFPFTVEIRDKEAYIKNFLGEKVPRKLKILPGVEVKIEKEIITISSIDKELAGQAAADFERATLVKKRDRRIFQDGIYITSKVGRDI